MTTVQIPSFSGTVPRTGPNLLSNTQAQIASNGKLQSGELRAWRKPVLTYTPFSNPTKTVFEMIGPGTSFAWLDWANDVDVCSGPIADPPPGSSTLDARLYYTGDGVPKKTNWNLATNSGVSTGTSHLVAKPVGWYNMGVAAPTGAVTTAVAAGTAGSIHVVTYVYTYISTFGQLTEESAPSPASAVTTTTSGNQTVNLSGWATAQHTANDNITAIRIYRSVTGANTSTFTYVDQIPVTPSTGGVTSGGTSTGGVVLSGTTYADVIPDSSLGSTTLTSTYFTPPPSTLTGLVAMPNGILAGFTGNQIWFCEPYQPHAWPSTYMLTTEYPIVGLGVYGNTLVVTTTLNPYLITGNTSSQMTQEKLPMRQPCVSKRSIAYDQFGVLYASPNGLVAIGPGVQDLISQPLFTRDEWQAIAPTTLIGAIYNNFYLGFYTVAGTPNVYSSVVIARGDQPPLSNFDLDVNGIFLERSTGAVYAIKVSDNNVYQLDADTLNNTLYTWKSKRFFVPEPSAFAAFRVQADYDYMNNTAAYTAYYNSVVAANNTAFSGSTGKSLQGDVNAQLQTLGSGAYGILVNGQQVNGSILQNLPAPLDTRYISVTFIGDSNQFYSTNVTGPGMYRLPAQAKYNAWEIQFTGNCPVRSFAMATTPAELKGVA